MATQSRPFQGIKANQEPRKQQKTEDEPEPAGTVIAQFETAEGERTGPQLDIPLNTTANQLQLIINQLLNNEDKVPYSFYIGDEEERNEVGTSLSQAVGKASTEATIRIVYVPQAVFRCRAVTRCTSTLSGHAEAILSSSFNADGRTLATGSGDHTVRLWDVMTETPKATLKAHRDWVLCVAWSPCGKLIASGGKDGKVAIWEAANTEKPLRVIEKAHKLWVNSLAWEPYHVDGVPRLASASKDGTARLWEARTGRALFTLSGHSNSVSSVKWGGEGLVFTGAHDRTVKVWAAAEGKLVRSLDGHGHWVNCLALTTDGAIRSGPYDHKGHAPADESQAREAAAKRYNEVRGAAELLASGSDDFTVFLWSPANSKKPIARLTGHVQLVNNVCFSPDGHWLATASFDGSVRLWAARTGKFHATLRGHVGAVYQLCWSGDSRSAFIIELLATRTPSHDLLGSRDLAPIVAES